MSRIVRSVVAVVAVATLAACSSGTPTASTSTTTEPATNTEAPTTTTEAAPAGVRPGIVVAQCDIQAGNEITVSSFEPTATTASSSTVFQWQPIGADTYSPAVDCVGLGGLVGSNNVGGRELRAGFNKDYTKALGTNTANQAGVVGWLTPDDQFTQLSPTVTDDFAKQLDTNPMYHPGTDRIYYWDTASQPAQLMSLAADGGTPGRNPRWEKATTRTRRC